MDFLLDIVAFVHNLFQSPIQYGASVLPPNTEESSRLNAHPHINCKIKSRLRSVKP